MKTKIIIGVFLTANSFIAAHGQGSFGAFAEAGASKFKLVGFENDPYLKEPYFKLTTHYLPSAKAGFYYDCIVKDKFRLGSKLFITTVASNAEFYVQWDTITPPQSWQAGTISVRLLGFGLEPLHIGYKYKKVSLNAGIQASTCLAYSYRIQYTNYSYGGMNGTTLEENLYEEKERVTTLNGEFFYDLGITASIAYHFSKRLTAEANYYFDIRNSISSGDAGLKLRQLNFGIKYALWVSKKNETKTTVQ